MAGLVGGELSYGDVIDTCYSASARLNGSEKLTYSTAKPADVTTGKPDITSTYYMSHGDHDMDGTVFADYEQWSGRNRADAIEKYLNDAFTAETGGSDTVAYNLMDGMGLSLSDAVRLLLVRVAAEKALPFEIRVPNTSTIRAMEDVNVGTLESFESVTALMASIDENN